MGNIDKMNCENIQKIKSYDSLIERNGYETTKPEKFSVSNGHQCKGGQLMVPIHCRLISIQFAYGRCKKHIKSRNHLQCMYICNYAHYNVVIGTICFA